MVQTFFSGKQKLGIIGGGQLGKMLLQCTRLWDIHTKVLDPDAEAPARWSCNEFFQGSLLDYDTVYLFGRDCSAVTIEIENVNVAALKKLQSEGVVVHPNPEALSLIQDKGLQKQFFIDHQLPTSPFKIFQSREDVTQAIRSGEIRFPFVQKTRTAGYDGRGVAIIESEAGLEKLLDAPCLVEDKVDVQYELAVVASRNEAGEVNCFDPVYMDFHPEANLLDLLLYPAPVDATVVEQTKSLAKQLIEKFDICGVLAVEFLMDRKGHIWINEVAPRPHNSGHQTIESSESSQYEQHIRGVLNLPLGSVAMITPSAMVNLLGAEGYEGAVAYEGIEECIAIQGVHIHIYGKKKTKPFRKMGHVTITDRDIYQAKKTALWVKQTLQVKSH